MYDRNCFELAEWFLADEGPQLRERAADLAQHIQDEIEGWIQAERPKPDDEAKG